MGDKKERGEARAMTVVSKQKTTSTGRSAEEIFMRASDAPTPSASCDGRRAARSFGVGEATLLRPQSETGNRLR